MSMFDIIVLIVVALAAITGFVRGFVQELLALAAWAAAILAIAYFHDDLYVWLTPHVGSEAGAGILAFVVLMLVPYMVVRLLAPRIGRASRNSNLGPLDRVLGFGFGGIKGGAMVVIAFSLLVLAYDSIWGVAGRPDWMTQARTYPLINASADQMVELIEDRRAAFRDGASEGAAGEGEANEAVNEGDGARATAP